MFNVEKCKIVEFVVLNIVKTTKKDQTQSKQLDQTKKLKDFTSKILFKLL